jgi:N-acetyl-anhydromuramyl-L-alanine amidase AmpD
MFALATIAGGSIPSPNYSSRGGATVTGVVIHSTEGLTDANALGNYFAKASVQASSHVGIDDTKTVAYVDPKFEAWTLRNGNPWTDNAEMCAFAHWTRAEWLAHPGMLQQAAAWVAERCHARNIPPKRITAADIQAGRRTGYFAHWDYTQGTGDGTHWDVGTGFPWDIFDGLVQAAYNGTGDDDMTPDQSAKLDTIHRLLTDDTAGKDRIGDIYNRIAAVEARLITDPGAGSDRLRDLWQELEAIKALLPAKPAA